MECPCASLCEGIFFVILLSSNERRNLVQELINELILCGFPEECAEDVVSDLLAHVGYSETEKYIQEVERNLNVYGI